MSLRSRVVSLVLICVLGTSALLAVHIFGEAPGLDVYDGLQRRYPEKRASQVALINIDQASLEKMLVEQGVSFPFDRAVYGELIEACARLGVRAIAFDILFSEPSSRGPEDDLAFGKAIEQSPIPIIFPGTPGEPRVPMPIRELQKPNVRYADVEVLPDRDGVIRRVEQKSGAFARVVAEAVGAISRDYAHSGWLRYSRPGLIPEESFYNVLISKRMTDAEIVGLRSTFSGKVVIVGYKAPGLFDVRASPVDRASVGSWVQANALSEVLMGSPGIRPAGGPGILLALLLIGLLWWGVVAIVRPLRPSVLFAISAGLSVLPVVLVTHLAWRMSLWLNPLPIIGGMLAITTAHFLAKVRGDWKERLAFARLLQHSMSPEMLELVRSGRIQVSRFGERRPVAVLFADLAGFTTLAENMPPEKLVELVNDYLDEAVGVLLPYGAYIDKFIGDAVMAIWGAPISDRLVLDNVIEASFKLLQVSDRLKSRWVNDHGLQSAPHVRIGVHLGNAVVGNIGARNRFNYTAVGDVVNVASRLESLGKLYQQSLVVSGELLAGVAEASKAEFMMIDRVVLKGRREHTEIFSPAGSLTQEQQALYRTAFSSYSDGRFTEAFNSFSTISEFHPARALAERCRGLILGVGLENWNKGIWGLDEK